LILRQPNCAFAVMTAVVAYAVMSLLMTSAPLAMYACGFEFQHSATVIQLHIFGMFAPSFFTGHLIQRLGVMRVIMAGILLNIICVATHLAGISFVHFGIGLLVLGVGWNFMFIGATTLLTDTHRPSERGKVQGFNDLAIFATVALAAFSSGNLLHFFGWDVINYGVLPVLVLVLIVSLRAAYRATARA
jgi:MFS family permease